MKRNIILLLFIWVSCLTCALFSQSIPIMASHAIRAEYNTLENYKNIEECGFTLACEYYPSRDYAVRHLATASKTNVKLIVWCPEILKDMMNTVRMFNKYKSFGGYLLYDEPGADKFAKVAKEYAKLKSMDDNHHVWINLYPITAEKYRLQTNSYETYIANYLDIVNPSFLSFDNYGIDKDGIRADYFQNLEVISSKCKIAKTPFWAYVLTSQFGNYVQPTKGTLSFQAYNNFAYGAQGIEYFSYRRILDYGLNMVCAPVDTNYQKMPVYQDVKELNAEITYYSKYFYGCDVKEVTHLSKVLPFGTNHTRNLPAGIKECGYSRNGFVVSSFTKDKHEYLMFVNKDYSESQAIILNLPRKIKRLSYYSNERFKGKGMQTFVAQAGSIILLRLK